MGLEMYNDGCLVPNKVSHTLQYRLCSLHNMNTKFHMCRYGIKLDSQVVISLYLDINSVQAIAHCQGKLTSSLLRCLLKIYKFLQS